MKRQQFIQELERTGLAPFKHHGKRHGKRHDIDFNPANGRSAPVPRHTEFRKTLCSLIRQLGIE